jgi:hypothetical protein
VKLIKFDQSSFKNIEDTKFKIPYCEIFFLKEFVFTNLTLLFSIK